MLLVLYPSLERRFFFNSHARNRHNSNALIHHLVFGRPLLSSTLLPIFRQGNGVPVPTLFHVAGALRMPSARHWECRLM